MLNKDVLARDPASYRLADGGVAKVSFPPEDGEQKAILREQLDTFVCEGAYAEALRRILDTFNVAAGRRGDVPAAWISGFFIEFLAAPALRSPAPWSGSSPRRI
jgi:hypothetical protein